MNSMSVARAVRSLALGIWLGGIVMAFLAASVVFSKKIGLDRGDAGNIVLAILQTSGSLQIALSLVALGAEAALFFARSPARPEGWRRFVPAVSLLMAVVVLLFMMLWLQPKILELREKIANFSEATANSPERIEFGKWHGASMGLMMLDAILVAVAQVTGLL